MWCQRALSSTEESYFVRFAKNSKNFVAVLKGAVFVIENTDWNKNSARAREDYPISSLKDSRQVGWGHVVEECYGKRHDTVEKIL